MVDDHIDFLAAEVLNEQQIVTYRSVSRALKVHNHVAKEMLADFYKRENDRKPGSVYATYLICGRKSQPLAPQANGKSGTSQNTEAEDDDEEDEVLRDVPMTSSPFRSSPAPPEMASQGSEEDRNPVITIKLAREENFEATKALFEEVSAVHIYSLGPTSVKDLRVIADANRKVRKDYADEDPLTAWKQYGVIQNSDAWRRQRKGPGPPPPEPAKRTTAPTAAKAAVNTSTMAKPKLDSERGAHAVAPGNIGADNDEIIVTKPTTKPTLKKEKSDIASSFAKTKAPRPRAKAKSPSPDEPMKDAEEDEQEEDFAIQVRSQAEIDADKKAKAERQAKLKQIMEDDDEDEDMPDAPAETTKVEDEGADEEDEPEEAPPAAAPEAEAPELDEKVTVTNGRRRGKRRVMKKKTVKDEEGYLVTREEAVWESFSEDEPEPKRQKQTAAPAAPAPKTGAKGGKPGQGNIMSFFSKKS